MKLSYIPIPERLKPFLVGEILKGCGSKPSYVARVKRELLRETVERLRMFCDEFKMVGGMMVKCRKTSGSITFFPANGRLMFEASSEEEAFKLIERLFVGPPRS